MSRTVLHNLCKNILEQGYFSRLTYMHLDSEKGVWRYYNSIYWEDDAGKAREKELKLIYNEHQYQVAQNENYIEGIDMLKDTSRWNNILRILKTEPEISRFPENYDYNKNLINLQNGTYNLAKGKFREHRAEDMMTMVFDARYDETAKRERWDRFLMEVLCDDREVKKYIHKYLGYSISASTAEQCFLFLYGDGCNGKSVLTEVIANITGDYSHKISNQILTGSKDKSAKDRKEQIYANLMNTRIAFTSETSQNMKLDESGIKDMTGCNTLASRALYEDYKEYTPIFKFILEGNYKPTIKGTDYGIWRRVKVVKFGRTFKPDEIDRDLTNKLLAERDGILMWLIEGYHKWEKEGLGTPPASMELELKEYRTDSDILGQFIEEKLEQSPEARTDIKEIYASYKSWMSLNCYESNISQRKLTSELQKRGYERDGSNIHNPKILGVQLLHELNTA